MIRHACRPSCRPETELHRKPFTSLTRQGSYQEEVMTGTPSQIEPAEQIKRRGNVRDYLAQQGMAGSSVTTKGLGKTQPVASNDKANGRVELVISGEVSGYGDRHAHRSPLIESHGVRRMGPTAY